jgi:hypothetical protein
MTNNQRSVHFESPPHIHEYYTEPYTVNGGDDSLIREIESDIGHMQSVLGMDHNSQRLVLSSSNDGSNDEQVQNSIESISSTTSSHEEESSDTHNYKSESPTDNRQVWIQPFRLSSRNSNSKVATERVKQELEQKFKQECTFTPKINRNYSSPKGTKSEERWTSLAQSRRNELMRREQEKIKRESEAVNQQCTFKPKTLKRSASADRRSTTQSKLAVIDRLFTDAHDKLSKREKTKRILEDQEIESCTFAPQVNSNRKLDKGTYQKPQDKAGIIQREKQEKLRELKMKQLQENPDLTFNPQISEESARIASKSRAPMNVFDRNQFSQMEKRLKHQAAKVIKQDEAECTFQPSLNPKSQQILQQSKLYNNMNNNFFERQEVKQLREDQKVFQNKEKENVDLNKLFKPHVNKTSQILAKYMRPDETEEEKVQRLAKEDLKKKTELQNEIQQQYYSQFTFKPSINPVSKEIGQATVGKELVENERNKRIKQQLAEELGEEWKKTYSFKPTLVATTYQAQQSKYKLIDPNNIDATVDNVKRYNEEKEKRLSDAKKIQEYNEMQACTFQPNTARVRPKTPTNQPRGPVIIRGLGKHLERRDRAKKLEEEKKEREEKVFRPRVKGQGTNLPYTIPVPFKNLHPDNYANNKQIKHMDLCQKYYEEETKKYGHTPKTNIVHHHSSNSAIPSSS